MGASVSRSLSDASQREQSLTSQKVFRSLGNWTLQDVRTLKHRFDAHGGNFGLIVPEFVDLLSFKRPPVNEPEAVFAVLDHDNNGRIDGLELLASLTMICDGPFESKVTFCFELCDFNLNGSLSREEMTLMLRCVVCGTAKLLGDTSPPPPDAQFETLSADAFKSIDLDLSDCITIVEFLRWARRSRDVMVSLERFNAQAAEAARDVPSDDSADELEEPEDADVLAEADPKPRDEQQDPVSSLTALLLNAPLGGGDEFMAVKPWLGAIKEPTAWAQPRDYAEAPDAHLELEWVHGYRAQDCRNNLRYVEGGLVAYSAAALGVVYDPETHSQRFYHGHTDDIVSLAAHPSGKYVATGELGRRPSIHVWSPDTRQPAAVLSGFHQRGVSLLAFSNDGTLLASAGLDNDHSIAVYDWQSRKLVASGRGDPGKLLGMCFTPDDQQLVVVGCKVIKFFDVKSRALRARKGLLGRQGRIQTLLCVAPHRHGVVAGTASGHLYLFTGRQLTRVVKAHKDMQAVSALFWDAAAGSLLSGSKDGTIKFWDAELRPVRDSVDMGEPYMGSLDPAVRSVCVGHSRLLVGTRACEVYEVDLVSGSASRVVAGHYGGELWGLAIHPREAQYYTCGDDKTLRQWCVRTRTMLASARLHEKARAAAVSSDGDLLVVGLVSGAVLIFDALSLKPVQSFQHSKQWIQDIKFSPDNSTLAVSSHDNRIYLYSRNGRRFTKSGICVGHSSYITHVDFSADSAYLQSNCGAYELLFWTCTGEQVRSASAMRDVEWGTWTCVLGWPVQGIWSLGKDGTDVNAVCRSSSGNVLAAADDSGRVSLFRYPCVSTSASCNSFRGHSSHVTNVRFTPDDRYVLSSGGNDLCLFQWRYVQADTEPDEPAVAAEDMDSDVDQDGVVMDRSAQRELANNPGLAAVLADTAFAYAPAGGDEFMAVKPWLGAIKEPSWYKASSRSNDDEPDAHLELEWVHGYRSHDCRNNLRYLAGREVVFHAAALGVVYDPETNTQRFNMEHTDDVLSLAVHPSKRYVATGEAGRRPKIVVWDAQTCATVAVLEGFHTRGVGLLAFDMEDNLISMGLDNDHTIAVYDWKRRQLVTSAKGNQAKVLDLAVNPHTGALVTCGIRHVKFWTLHDATLRAQRGLLGRRGEQQTFACIGFTSSGTVTGTSSGQLYVWHRHTLVRCVSAHTGIVNALWTWADGVVSGGKDGQVITWRWDAEQGKLSQYGEALGPFEDSLAPSVRSVCLSDDEHKLLVGTRGGEAFEMPVGGGDRLRLFGGHCAGEVWGLAVHPTQPMYYTVGDDCTLRLWHTAARYELARTVLPGKARAVAVSPTGELVAVGLMTGGVVVVQPELVVSDRGQIEEVKLPVVAELEVARAWIQDIKFSPDGALLAVGAHDDRIYLFSCDAGTFTPRHTLRGHSSYVTHLDFSADSAYLQSNCGAYELLFWDTATGEQVRSASRIADAEWGTWTCVLGWPVQGIWSLGKDGTDVNAVCRASSGNVLAAGDDFGRVNLFKYPTISTTARCCAFRGHSSHVTNVRFTPDDRYLLSAGGRDLCVLQWRTVDVEAGDGYRSDGASSVASAGNADVLQEGVDADPIFNFDRAPTSGDEFMAVKPWLGAIKEPTGFRVRPGMAEAPDAHLELEWVHGYRSKDCRNNVRYVAGSEVVFHAAALGVVYDSETHSQRFHTDHTDDVISLAVHPKGEIVATGEVGKSPKIMLWDVHSGNTLATMAPFHKRGVAMLTFSNRGDLVASVGLDDDHSVAVHRTNGQLLASARGDRNKVLDMAYSPDDSMLVTVGVKHVRFWSFAGCTLQSKKGLFGAVGGRQTVLCVAFLRSNPVTGQLDGTLCRWSGRNCVESKKAHGEGPVFALASCHDFEAVVSGGKDGRVVLWDASLTPLATHNMAALPLPPLNPAVRSVCCQGSMLLVGTAGSEIYELNMRTNQVRKLTEGHCTGELWGLAVHPADQIIATAGDDKTLRLWDARARRMAACRTLGQRARACAFSPQSGHLAVALVTGMLEVYDAQLRELLASQKCGKDWIQTMKYSPDGRSLAVGSHDNRIYIFNTAPYSLRAICKGHSSYITHLDFSVDSRYLQSNCGAYELLFWDATTGRQVTSASSLRDVRWHTWTCTLGFPVQGIWPPETDGTDINAVHRSDDGNLLVTADDFGKVKLFKYPCVTRGAKFKPAVGHSSHVTNVRFTASDAYVVSTGGNDNSLLQFRVRK